MRPESDRGWVRDRTSPRCREQAGVPLRGPSPVAGGGDSWGSPRNRPGFACPRPWCQGEELITFLASVGLLAGAAQGPLWGCRPGCGPDESASWVGVAWPGKGRGAGRGWPRMQGLFLQPPRQLITPGAGFSLPTKPFPRTLAPALTSAEGVALQERVLYCPLEVFRDWRGRGEGRRAPQPVFQDLWPPSPFPMGSPGAVHAGVLTSGPWPPERRSPERADGLQRLGRARELSPPPAWDRPHPWPQHHHHRCLCVMWMLARAGCGPPGSGRQELTESLLAADSSHP